MSSLQAFEPEWAVAPGVTIASLLARQDFDHADFAWQMDFPVDVLPALFEGKVTIDEGFARRLERVLGVSADFWLLREAQFRADVQSLAERVPNDEARAWVKRLPLKDMAEYGWINRSESLTGTVSECFRFFDVFSLEQYEQRVGKLAEATKLRTSPTFRSKPDALNAWLRFGQLQAESIDCERWSAEKLKNMLPEMRKLTQIRDAAVFLPKLRSLCSAAGVALVIARAPSGCRASGATMKLNGNKALLLLSFRHLSDDHFWFSFFHECGHLILHADYDLVVEGEPHQDDEIEAEANRFSEDVLLPNPWRQLLTKLKANKKDVIRFAVRAGVSPGIVVGQMQHRGIIEHNYLNYLKRRYTWRSTPE